MLSAVTWPITLPEYDHYRLGNRKMCYPARFVQPLSCIVTIFKNKPLRRTAYAAPEEACTVIAEYQGRSRHKNNLNNWILSFRRY